MSRNTIKDSHNVNMMKWRGASAEFKEQTKAINGAMMCYKWVEGRSYG